MEGDLEEDSLGYSLKLKSVQSKLCHLLFLVRSSLMLYFVVCQILSLQQPSTTHSRTHYTGTDAISQKLHLERSL